MTSIPPRRARRRALVLRPSIVVSALAVMLAGSALLVSSAPSARAADLTGEIRVTKQIDGEGPLAGWDFTISNDQAECSLPSDRPATVSTDASGLATFAGLPLSVGDVTCTYTLSETPVAGYEMVTAAADLTGLTAGSLVPASESGVALSTVSGYFDNPTRNDSLAIACLAGEGTDEMRAGRNPFTGACSLAFEDQSGVGFSGQTSANLPVGYTPIAKLTHFNQTIQRGFSGADLHVALTFTDVATSATQSVTANYHVTIDETSDTANPCAYPGGPNGNLPGGFGCADRFTIGQPDPANVPVSLGAATVNLNLAFLPVIDGVCDAAATPTSSAYTAEQTDTSFCLVALVAAEPTVVPTEVTVVNRPVAVVPTDTTSPSETPSSSETASASQTPQASQTPSPSVTPSASDSPSASESPSPSETAPPSETVPATESATGTPVKPEGSSSALPTIVTVPVSATSSPTSPGGGGLPDTGARLARGSGALLAVAVLATVALAVRRRLS